MFSEDDKQKAEGKPGSILAQRGFVAVPSVGSHGGIVARGPIYRDVTVNLVALRQLEGEGGEDGKRLRRYILGLALLAATDPQDGFLRQGCLLTLKPETGEQWESVERSGRRQPVTVDYATLVAYAEAAAKAFGVGPDKPVKFDPSLAKADLPEADAKKLKKKAATETAPAE